MDQIEKQHHNGLQPGDRVVYTGWAQNPEYGKSFGTGVVVKLCKGILVQVRWPVFRRPRNHAAGNLRIDDKGAN